MCWYYSPNMSVRKPIIREFEVIILQYRMMHDTVHECRRAERPQEKAPEHLPSF